MFVGRSLIMISGDTNDLPRVRPRSLGTRSVFSGNGQHALVVPVDVPRLLGVVGAVDSPKNVAQQ